MILIFAAIDFGLNPHITQNDLNCDEYRIVNFRMHFLICIQKVIE